MIKIKTLMGLGALSFALLSQAAEKIAFNDNDNVLLRVSQNSINRIFIQDDAITDVHVPDGYLVGTTREELTDSSGALYVQLALTSPFTLYISTQQGHHLGLRVEPARVSGKTVQLMPRTATPKAKSWEETKGYEAALLALMKAMMKNEPPMGYGIEEISEAPQKFDEKGKRRLKVIYNGIHLKGKVYELSNQGPQTLILQETQFNHIGVEAVSIESTVLGYYQKTYVYVVEKQS